MQEVGVVFLNKGVIFFVKDWKEAIEAVKKAKKGDVIICDEE